MQNNFITFRPEIKDVKVKKVELTDNIYHVFGDRTDKRDKCCGKKMNIHDYRVVNIRSLGYGNKRVVLHIKKQRYICPKCRRRITSKLDIVEKNCSISEEVKKEIRRKIKEMKSFKQIGMEEGTSISTVLRIFNDIRIPEKEFDYETVYFDEFKGNAGKEKYQLAIYDTNHELIEILKDRKTSTIKEFLLPHSKKIKKVSIDMFMQFRNMIATYFPDADIVADKYHVIRQGNWMIRNVRIRLFNSDARYKDYKKYWKLIAKNPDSTFTPSQKKRLEKLKDLSEIFSRAYDLRTKFFSIFEIKDVTVFSYELWKLTVELKESGIKECMKLGETLKNWEEEISNIQKYNINNGFVEGKNNKIKVIKRISYGIKKFDNLKKLIQLRIS